LDETIPHFRRVSFEIYRDADYVRGRASIINFVQALDHALRFFWDAFREPHYSHPKFECDPPHGLDQAALSWQGVLSSAEQKTFEYEGRYQNGCNWLMPQDDPNRNTKGLMIDSREVCLRSANSAFVHGKMWEMKAPLDDSDDE
jgi:hypothetical protein